MELLLQMMGTAEKITNPIRSIVKPLHNKEHLFLHKKIPPRLKWDFWFYNDFRIRFRIILGVFFRITTFQQQLLRLRKRLLHA